MQVFPKNVIKEKTWQNSLQNVSNAPTSTWLACKVQVVPCALTKNKIHPKSCKVVKFKYDIWHNCFHQLEGAVDYM